MQSTRNRASRNHHRKRLIFNRINERHRWFVDMKTQADQKSYQRATGRLADTPTPCSCTMCGNPRKYFSRRTLHEKRADLNQIDWDRVSVSEMAE